MENTGNTGVREYNQNTGKVKEHIGNFDIDILIAYDEKVGRFNIQYEYFNSQSLPIKIQQFA